MAKLFNSNTLSREELDKIEGVAPASELPTETKQLTKPKLLKLLLVKARSKAMAIKL